MTGFPCSQIGQHVNPVATSNPGQSESDQLFKYVDISSVDRGSKTIAGAQDVMPSLAPSRARQIIRAGDVLVSTVRPKLNVVAWVPPALDGAIASTGFCVLRPKVSELDGRYLYHWVRTQQFVNVMLSRATGATYPAISDRIVMASTLPFPPLPEQRRIAAILDKADAIRRKRQQAIQLTDDLLRSAFLDMFGDPVENPKGWPRETFAKALGAVEAGWSANGDDRPVQDGEWAVLKISAVTSGHFDASQHKVVAELPRDKRLLVPKRGDLLFSRANTCELVGATALVEADEDRLFLPDKLWRLIPDRSVALPEYLRFVLGHRGYRASLAAHATGTSGSMVNVSQAKLLRMAFPLPPIDLQTRFASLVWHTFSARDAIQRLQVASNALFGSLVQRAFRGEL